MALRCAILEVAESTPNYEQFERRGRRYDTPAIVSVRDHNGVVRGEHIYTERGINYLHQVFSESGFRFEKFLDSVESPLINVAAGGYHFAWLLSKLNLDRQENLPRGQRRKYIDVFSLDRSGAYRTFTTNPWYLFGDLYATGLPDDTFGAVITLGGPLNRVTLPRFEYIAALRELGRIAAPRGRLLIEYSIPTGKMLAVLEESGLNYLNFLTYESREHPRWKSSRRSQLIDISLAEDSTLP